VYFTSAANHSLTLADVTFGNGVMAVGFDLKAGGGTPRLSNILRSVVSGDSPVSARFRFVTPPDGPVLNSPVRVNKWEPHHKDSLFLDRRKPNLDLVLDNFVLPRELDVRITAIADHRATTSALCGTPLAALTNAVRLLRARTTAVTARTSRTSAAPSSSPAPARSAPITSTAAAQTNFPARYYRVRLVP